MADSAAHLVDEILPDKPIRQWVLSVPFPLRFLFAAQPGVMSKVLGVVYRVISTFLNLHYHMLYLDGVYDKQGVFYPVKSPTYQDIECITQKIAERVSRYLEKAGYLIRDVDTEYLDLDTDKEDTLQSFAGASICYRLAFGPNAGKKALTLKTLPATFEPGHHDEQVSQRAGFSLHAGVACKAGQGKSGNVFADTSRAQPLQSEGAAFGLSLANDGSVIVELKSPYSDGTSYARKSYPNKR
ncbi:MAG: hypothetical protein ACJA2O_002884, partial [Candidatus Azotimanducaceae bacterium]